MDSDLKLIQECGFNSFKEVVTRINELVNVMRNGRARAEKYLERFTNEAKKLLKEGQKDKAKRELLKRKNHAERVKAIDTQLDVVLQKLREVGNSTQMLQVLKAAKYCNNILLSELGQKDLLKEKNELNENQDLIENDKEITKYLEIITNNKKKKVAKSAEPQVGPTPQKVESTEQDNNFPKLENMVKNPPENNTNENIGNNPNINNNFGINQNNNNITNNNIQNQVINPFMDNNNSNYKMPNYNNNQNNNFNNNNYTVNNPYDAIFK